jgi:hypothetical protein
MSGKRSRKRRAAAQPSPAAAPESPPRRRYRWVLRVAALLAAGAAAALWYTREHSKEGLTIENRSGQRIAVLKAKVAGLDSSFQNIPSGADVTAPSGGAADNLYNVTGELADGTLIRGNGRLEGRSRFTIVPGGGLLPRQQRP